jgi:hypothetical protein
VANGGVLLWRQAADPAYPLDGAYACVEIEIVASAAVAPRRSIAAIIV